MPAVYLTDVIGDGLSTVTAYRPDIAGARFSALMVDEPKGKAIIASPDNALTGAGIVQLVSDATWETMRTKAATTAPTGGQRTTVNNWATANGYTPLPAGGTWESAIHHLARQVNPAADLAVTWVG